MTLTETARHWVSAWRTGSAEEVAAVIASFADPDTREPVRGEALTGHLDAVFRRFPKWTLDVETVADAGPTAVVTWTLTAPHRAPYLGIPVTGGGAEVRGVRGCDVLSLVDGEVHVRRYHDRLGIAESLGHTARFLPPPTPDMEYGTSFRAATDRTTQPGAFTLTWLDARDEEEGAEVTLLSTEVVKALRPTKGFLGAAIFEIGNRKYTLSAFDTLASVRAVHARPHQRAMRKFFKGGLCTGAYTSVWQLERDSLYLRCPSCDVMVSAAEGASCDCGWTPPPSPLFSQPEE
ncbi:ester cyclase [Saccharomonospora xinjiangensis]|uniref:SnoaL-like polyketide cyclase n=1 Tax=Saccharomonospora xinjiangensis XJ-54 TaxID=882086 RepID=I0V5I3_9PSEU|nr:ester cyclase [Saccharomonospora xinjiangensis]EID55386.1 SnoaL-like polyketide cyclase [Saccharomonospora xinjiangensis XJ-54]QBQ61630.1 SnoaL-like polyketide cyclase [Saccharomonospora xinjiangensis]